MGDKLQKYYELVEAKGGLKAKMRMAMKTNVPSNKAGDAEGHTGSARQSL